jgi:hypothetical protein
MYLATAEHHNTTCRAAGRPRHADDDEPFNHPHHQSFTTIITYDRRSKMPNKWPVCFLVAMWSSQAQADTSPRASNEKAQEKTQAIRSERVKANVITNQEALAIYKRYVDGWRAISSEQRTKIATDVIAENVQYSTPRHESGGRETIIEDMVTFQNKFPEGHFDVGDVSAHHDVALLTWVLVQADGKIFARGHDQIRVSADGKIMSLITFAPSVSKP